MAKAARQDDEARLTTRVRERTGATGTPEGGAALRSLRKRLKRLQRKRRRLEARKRHAMGKKAKGEAKAEARPEAKPAEAETPEAKPPKAKTEEPAGA